MDGGALCAPVGDDTGVRDVRVGATPPDRSAAPGTPTGRSGLADHLVVEPGRGAVDESVAAPGAATRASARSGCPPAW
ncbi:hypothetical protein A6A27_32965 [Micromonospora sp. CB01531]|nr:hypothetical protein A6A27_32965 [Micromonospora sp. CB01531]